MKRKLKIDRIRKYVLVADAIKEFKIQETISYYKQSAKGINDKSENESHMEEVLRLSFDLQRTSYKLKLILLPTHATIKKANNKTSRKGLSAQLPFLKSIQEKRKGKKKTGWPCYVGSLNVL